MRHRDALYLIFYFERRSPDALYSVTSVYVTLNTLVAVSLAFFVIIPFSSCKRGAKVGIEEQRFQKLLESGSSSIYTRKKIARKIYRNWCRKIY